MSTAEQPHRPSLPRRIWSFVVELWDVLRRPSSVFGLGVLVLAGFAAGVVFWGGFNTALELTNTEKFCTGCHEMRDNVFSELKSTIHFSNRSGVRASCPDCHVPHNWTDKIARKMQASKEVWGHLFGSIDTPTSSARTGSSSRCTNGHGSRRTTRWNAATATAPCRWTLPSSRRARQWPTNGSCSRVRKPASIATRALPTICRTCAASRAGNRANDKG
jgi:hypothetical protein